MDNNANGNDDAENDIRRLKEVENGVDSVAYRGYDAVGLSPQASGMVIWPPMSGENNRRIVPYLRNACAIMSWQRSSTLNIRLSRSDQVA